MRTAPCPPYGHATGTHSDYFFLPAANPPKRGQHWYYAYARTLPGYPTLTRDHGENVVDR